MPLVPGRVAYLADMPVCPVCRDEYEDHVVRCADCAVDLVAPGEPVPPVTDARLGTFHPAVLPSVIALLDRRGIEHDALPVAEDRIEVLVERGWRDDLRAELALHWTDLVAALPPEQRSPVMADGGQQPGWFDAPRGAWVDRQGRLQVDAGEDELLEEDASRQLGPSLLVLGLVLLVFGWYADASAGVVVLGLGLALVGVLLPR